MSDPQFNSVDTNSLESVGKGKKMANENKATIQKVSLGQNQPISKKWVGIPKYTSVSLGRTPDPNPSPKRAAQKVSLNNKYQNRKTTAGK